MIKKILIILSIFAAFKAYAQTPPPPPDLFGDEDVTESIEKNDDLAEADDEEQLLDEDLEIDTKRSLTENLKNNAPTGTQEEIQGDNKNWVGQLFSTVKSGEEEFSNKKVNPLASVLDERNAGVQRSNASIFDISGVMLRMSYPQAEAALLKRGFKKTMQKMDIPNFIRWRFEDKCRSEGVIGYERLNGCVIKLSKENKYEYVAEAQFNKYDTQETVNFYLTSTFTNNKVYKITYRTQAANNAGNSAKAIYLRNIKVYDFWKKINQKYGTPDNREDVIWSLGNNKPYLKAATGFLLLEDPMLRELDYTRMSREDQRFMNTDLYTF